ncbi:hypothetical protein ACHAWF_000814 [Thalassiosira exigua]
MRTLRITTRERLRT